MQFLSRIKKPVFDTQEEAEFQRDYSNSNLASARLIQLQVLFIFIAAGYLDYVLLGELATLMMFMRYLIFTPMLVVILLYTMSKSFKRHMQLTISIATVIVTLYVTSFTVLNEGVVGMIYFVGAILCVFVGFIYTPMLFKSALILSAFIFSMCYAALRYNDSFSDAVVEACTLLLIASILLALIACYGNERSARLNFKYKKLLNVQNEILEEKNIYLHGLATVDGLTGIANRRSFDDRLSEEWKRAERSSTPLSVLLMDVDYFKLYNDHYGHQKGDDCLIEIAQALSSLSGRAGDFVGRYGGEEFVFIVANADHKNAIALGEKLLAKIESLKLPHEKSKVSEFVTLSVGLATTIPGEEEDADPQQLIKIADKALYRAKESGRNRLVSAENLLALSDV